MIDVQTLIVSKHALDISKWLQSQQRLGKHQELENIVISERSRGNVNEQTYVLGTIPFELAAEAKQYFGIAFQNRSAYRYGDMTAQDMVQAGAYLQPYSVFPVTKDFIRDVLSYHLTNLRDHVQTNETPVTKQSIDQLVDLILQNISSKE